jgi:hypothetical protein
MAEGQPLPTQSDRSSQFDEDGISLISGAVAEADLAAMEAHFPTLGARIAGTREDGFSPEAQAWLETHRVLASVAHRLLAAPARPTRLLAFDKSVDANWFGPWHQDRAALGVERPVGWLERTVALRVHLDDCGADNGPLEVIPGSHCMGRLVAPAVAAMVADATPMVCLAARGDILAMRPLLVHRSQRAKAPSARRVVHIEFTALETRAA